MSNITNLRNVSSNRLDETIDINKVYFVRIKGQNPLAQKYGKDWVKLSEIKPRQTGKKKFYSWVDFLASGKLPNPGAMYEIITYENGADTPILVFAGVASTGDNLENQLSDNIDNSKTLIPTAGYNSINERSNFRTFSDAIQYQTNATINLLQDELRQKDALISEFSQRGDIAYSQFSERENAIVQEREELRKKNYELVTQIEALKRELELEKMRNSIEKEARERELKLERKLDKIQNQKTDWGKTLSDAIPVLSGLVPMLSGGKIPAIPMMANAVPPDYYGNDDTDNEESDDES